MRIYIFLIAVLAMLSGCSNDNYNNRNPYLPSYNFSVDLNMELPLYSQLQFTGNPVFVNQAGIGINGVIVMNTGGSYVAWEASCPNQYPESCSRLELDGINAICPCDDAVYSLYSGQKPRKGIPP